MLGRRSASLCMCMRVRWRQPSASPRALASLGSPARLSLSSSPPLRLPPFHIPYLYTGAHFASRYEEKVVCSPFLRHHAKGDLLRSRQYVSAMVYAAGPSHGDAIKQERHRRARNSTPHSNDRLRRHRPYLLQSSSSAHVSSHILGILQHRAPRRSLCSDAFCLRRSAEQGRLRVGEQTSEGLADRMKNLGQSMWDDWGAEGCYFGRSAI